MLRKFVISTVFLLSTIAIAILVVDLSSYKTGEQSAEESVVSKNIYPLPLGFSYSQYILQRDFDQASPVQKRYISTLAFVVNEPLPNFLNKLKQFKLADTATEASGLDSTEHAIVSSNTDTFQIVQSDKDEISGYVNLSEDKLLYFAREHHMEWQIEVDVTKFNPTAINNGRIGVFVEKGRHHIRLHYSNRFVKRDLIAILCWAVFLSGLWIVFKKKLNPESDSLNVQSSRSSTIKRLIAIMAVLAVPVAIYFYFLRWKTNTIYGDDLYVFNDYSNYHTYLERLTIRSVGAKFRPIHDIILGTSMQLFHKDLNAYYLLNVFIQSANAIAFGLIINVFLRSIILSLGLSLVVGFSRFAMFNITQITFGGPLEGIALTFFLFSVYFVIKTMVREELTVKQKLNGILWGILFANLAQYTHERYIVLFPFIVFVLIISPSLKQLKKSTRILLGTASMGSIVFNVFLKTVVFNMPFFMGTGNVEVKFSFTTAISYLMEGISSILFINTGPEYLGGIQYSSLPAINKFVILGIVCLALAVFAFYLYKILIVFLRFCVGMVVADQYLKPKIAIPHMHVFIALGALFFLTILPAIVTIRLEQRWLQAPFALFFLMVLVAISILPIKNLQIRNYLFFVFIACCLWMDYSYIDLGGNRLYFKSAEMGSNIFYRAHKNGTLNSHVSKLYVWKKQREPNTENDLIWSLGHCYFFDFYYNDKTQVVFVDSVYEKMQSNRDTLLPNFNQFTDQIVYIKYEHDKFSMVDLTRPFLEDSLKSFQQGMVGVNCW